jgi:hypothetical protein
MYIMYFDPLQPPLPFPFPHPTGFPRQPLFNTHTHHHHHRHYHHRHHFMSMSKHIFSAWERNWTIWFNSSSQLPPPIYHKFYDKPKKGSRATFNLSVGHFFVIPSSLNNFPLCHPHQDKWRRITSLGGGGVEQWGGEREWEERKLEMRKAQHTDEPRGLVCLWFNSQSLWFTTQDLIPCISYPQVMKNGSMKIPFISYFHDL